MRHKEHRHRLGVTKEHRIALMANLAVALFVHGRIQTTLAKAKALRPFAEKIITLAKKAATTEDKEKKLHYRRQAISQIRDSKAVAKLFDERVSDFLSRPGGYTRIYKLLPRRGDAAPIGIIELINADDLGYKAKRKSKRGVAPRAKQLSDETSQSEVKEKASIKKSKKLDGKGAPKSKKNKPKNDETKDS